MRKCEVEGCKKKKYSRFKRVGKWLCGKHYSRMYKHGVLEMRTHLDSNEIVLYKKYAEVILYGRNQKENDRTKIDLEDVERVKVIKWHKNQDNSVVNRDSGNNKLVILSRFLLHAKDGMEVDHINHDRLDNRKKNLRLVTRSQNKINRRGFPGYHWHQYNDKPGKWRVVIRQNKKTLYEKEFFLKEDAKIAARKARKKYHKEYACLDS